MMRVAFCRIREVEVASMNIRNIEATFCYQLNQFICLMVQWLITSLLPMYQNLEMNNNNKKIT